MILYICEKPSQARDIARHLKATQRHDGYLEGNGYQVTWCVGHLLALASPEHYQSDITPWHIDKLPVIPKTWEKIVLPKTKKQFNIIKQLLQHTSHVVIATDADREGESIAREVLEACHYDGHIERLWLRALDDASIQKALTQLKVGSDTESLYQSAKARSYADWLLGMNATMAVSSLYGVNSVLSVGRVQTPTLKLVVERDRLIEDFTPQTYFVLKALFSSGQQAAFWATWQVPDKVLDDKGYCVEQHIVDSVAAKIDDEPGVVKQYQESQKYQKAPVCFSLSALQKKASSLFGYSARQVLTIAQSLYETHKATTYPRTDCGFLPEEQFSEAKAVLAAMANADHTMQAFIVQCDPTFKSSVWNAKKVTAHHAIIPTMNDHVDIGKMSAEEINLYDLIRRQYLAQFLGDYAYLQRKVDIVCAGECFTATGHTPLTLGWKQAFVNKTLDDNHEEAENSNIPQLKQGQTVQVQETNIEQKQTQPPARFSEGTLIDAMKTVGKTIDDATMKKVLKESSGIGTEATRANILEVLFKRGYLQRKNKHVISTQKGRALIDIVPELVKNPILTAQWEQQLEAIAVGNGDLDNFVRSQVTLLNDILAQLQKNNTNNQAAVLQLQSDTQNGKVYLCPQCEAPLRRLKNKKGKYFWGCGRYPQCTFTTWEKKGKPSL